MVPISRHWSWNVGKLTGASKIATWVCLTVGHHWKTRSVVVGQFLIGIVEGFLSGLWGYLTTDWLPWTWGAWSKWEAIGRQTSDFFACKKKREVVPRICVKDVVSHESWVQIMLRAQIFQSQQRPHPQKPRQFDSQENDFESSNWKVEFFLLLALRSNMSKSYGISWGTSSGSCQR